MATGTDFLQDYQQTEEAYIQGNYEEAAALVYQLVEDYPDNPSARLLCGHIYYGLQQYDVARDQYMGVLSLTEDAELIEQAHQALTDTDLHLGDSGAAPFTDGEDSLSLESDSQAVFDDLLDEEIEATSAELGQPKMNGSSASVDLMDLAETDFELESLDGNLGLSNGTLHEIELNDFEADHFSMGNLNESATDLLMPELESGNGLELNQFGVEDLDAEEDFGASPFSSSATDDPFAISDDSDEEGTEILNPFDDSDAPNSLPVNTFTPEAKQPHQAHPLETPDFENDLEDFTGDFFSDNDEIEDLINSNHSTGVEKFNRADGHIPSQQANSPRSPQLLTVDDNKEEPMDGGFADLADFMLEDEPLNVPSNKFVSEPEVAAIPAASSAFEDELDDIFAPLEDTGDLHRTNPSWQMQPPDDDPIINAAQNHQVFEPAAVSASTFNPIDAEETFFSEDDLDFDTPHVPFDAPAFETLRAESPEESDALDSAPLPPNVPKMNNFHLLDHEETLEEETLLTDSSAQHVYFTNGTATSASVHSPQNGIGHQTMDEFDDSGAFAESGIPDSFLVDTFDEDTFGDSFDVSPDTNDTDTPVYKSTYNGNGSAASGNDFLEDFEEFDEVADFDIADNTDADMYVDSDFGNLDSKFINTTTSSTLDSDSSAIRDDEIFNSAFAAAAVTTLSPDVNDHVDTIVTGEQGPFAFLENASIVKKPLYTAIGTGLMTLLLVATATNIATRTAALENKRDVVDYLRATGWLMTAVAGAASFGTAWGLGTITARQISKATDDLQAQFDSISKGNLEARSTIYAEDEFGKMSAKFNHMAQFIQNITREAQRKAKEQEDARDDLHRQVIRLLDDVEGAARGDLTVTAEVTANVLGAVADSFNLTIQNLREIVLQVKQAARQVSKGATDSATFAKDVAGDAFRQAEELAATLNSVQVLTDSIQRVAESAREAEEVARSAAAVATKGGEAVQMTVAGILKIRETVAETSREVKRLGESTQEISKIVAIISQIASRTNLLALNASIEAARAGEAGKGFAIVADEVRQLADKSAKSLKDIEQIVMQIQSQTNTVMMAMSQGHQQVIEGTRLAEQAKRALDDIIQVTNRIDVLVRSITADTVEQNETARAVAQVMRAVEHSAQETSQEAQGVSSALTKLVGVARDLLTSVERFRVEGAEKG